MYMCGTSEMFEYHKAISVLLCTCTITFSPPSVITASSRFYSGQTYINYTTSEGTIQQQATLPLNSVTNPEEKRKIIGDTFMKVVESVVSDLQLQADNVYLAQGTLRPDLIESASSLASSKAHVIKTHHNDTELVRELRRKVRLATYVDHGPDGEWRAHVTCGT